MLGLASFYGQVLMILRFSKQTAILLSLSLVTLSFSSSFADGHAGKGCIKKDSLKLQAKDSSAFANKEGEAEPCHSPQEKNEVAAPQHEKPQADEDEKLENYCCPKDCTCLMQSCHSISLLLSTFFLHSMELNTVGMLSPSVEALHSAALSHETPPPRI